MSGTSSDDDDMLLEWVGRVGSFELEARRRVGGSGSLRRKQSKAVAIMPSLSRPSTAQSRAFDPFTSSAASRENLDLPSLTASATQSSLERGACRAHVALRGRRWQGAHRLAAERLIFDGGDLRAVSARGQAEGGRDRVCGRAGRCRI